MMAVLPPLGITLAGSSIAGVDAQTTIAAVRLGHIDYRPGSSLVIGFSSRSASYRARVVSVLRYTVGDLRLLQATQSGYLTLADLVTDLKTPENINADVNSGSAVTVVRFQRTDL